MTTKSRDISLYRDEIIDKISPISNNTVDHDVEFARRVLAVMSSKVIPALDKRDARIEELEGALEIAFISLLDYQSGIEFGGRDDEVIETIGTLLFKKG